MMIEKTASRAELLLYIEQLEQEVGNLKSEKEDLELILETTVSHADIIESLLQDSNQQLHREINEREKVEVALKASENELQSLLTILSQDKADLEIILETTTQHGDTMEDLLHDRALDTMRKSQRRLSQFLEAIPIGIFVIDVNGKPYYANRIAQQFLGKGVVPSTKSQELSTVYQVYKSGTNELYPHEQMPLIRALKGEKTKADDVEIRRKDKIIPLEVSGTPIFDEKGKIAYAIAIFQDITERKKAEAERQKLTHNLYDLNRNLEKALDTQLQLIEAYERFVPHEFLYFLGYETIVDSKLGDQVQCEMSVLFSDIRDFTALSETMTPEANFKFINNYLKHMEPAIIKNNGFIDKYIGDEIMALFSGNADDAVIAGISMLENLKEYNQHLISQNIGPISIGIGVNTGSLMLGIVGGPHRMDSTVISDAVNLASRIEHITKDYGVSFLISHETFWRLNNANNYAIRSIEKLKVRGKSKMVSIFEIFDADPPHIRDAKLATKSRFEEAILLYNNRNLAQSEKLFTECLRENPHDRVIQIYLERCQQIKLLPREAI